MKSENKFVEGLINCAGFGIKGLISCNDIEQIDSMIRVNLTVPAQLCRLVLPEMLKNDCGIIINISSSVAEVPLLCMALYAASKAGLSSFSNALWGEVNGTSVRVITVCP